MHTKIRYKPNKNCVVSTFRKLQNLCWNGGGNIYGIKKKKYIWSAKDNSVTNYIEKHRVKKESYYPKFSGKIKKSPTHCEKYQAIVMIVKVERYISQG